MHEMMAFSRGHGGWRVVMAVALLASFCGSARAVDPVPDFKVLVHTAVPRDGVRPSQPGEYEGEVRAMFESTVETFWKEISYHEQDRVTGEPAHGFSIDTRTLGYVDLPWPAYPIGGTNSVRPDAWTSIYDDRVNPNDKPGRSVTFGGEHNLETGTVEGGWTNGQLYGGTGPLVDGVWTPGERFQDLNNDGVYTPGSNVVIRGDDWWDSDNTNPVPRNWPGPNEISGYNGARTENGPPDRKGELYADYDGGSVTITVDGTTRVTRVDFDVSVLIYMANGQSNAAVTLSELDLTPNNNLTATNQPSEEGDFPHLHRVDPVGGGATNNLPRNHRFDYQVDGDAVPLVFAARNGANQVLTLSYKRWMLLGTNGVNAVYSGTQAAQDGAVQVDVIVPVYQSYELWGVPDGNVYTGLGSTWVRGVREFQPGEPFEDFISWWVPHAGEDDDGFWVGGINGGSISMTNMPLRSDKNMIPWATYTNYIAVNYPGDVAALIARAGNNQYDGPDNWLDKVDNKMQLRKFDEASTPPPGAWDPRGWYGGSWTSWWSAVFHSEPPAWVSDISICQPFAPAPYVPSNGKDGGWRPTPGSTWGYDGPREFQDMPSSLHHLGNTFNRGAYAADPYPSGGDLRLGEVTGPWSASIFGADTGPNDYEAPFPLPDKDIPSGGPLAYGGFGMYNLDARNQLNIELLTWRTDGTSLSGPTNPAVSRASGTNLVRYGGDHRDRTLDGLVDQGETIPAGSHCYFVDDNKSPQSIDGGFTRTCAYPFNWDRYAEDCMMINDFAEDYAQSAVFGATPIDEPLGTRRPARLATGLVLTNVFGVAAGVPHTAFAPIDSVWIDAMPTNAVYDAGVDTLLHGAAPANGTRASYAIPQVRFVDSDSSGRFTPASGTNLAEAAWVDATADGRFAANEGRRVPLYFVGVHLAGTSDADVWDNRFDCYTMDADYPIAGYVQVVQPSLAGLHHAMGHDMLGWPDLYDYDIYLESGYKNSPIAGFDLMAEGGLVHGVPDLKARWIEPTDLAQFLPKGGGIQSVYFFPAERSRDQYYSFVNPLNPNERFWFWYHSGVQANAITNFGGPGGRGLHIQHNDVTGTVNGYPQQQRHNNHYTLEMVQADGRYDMQDGVNNGGTDDVWPGATSNRVFSAFSIPPGRWWDQTDIGLRIHDVIMPTDPLGPMQVRFEYYDPALPWVWPADGADTDGDGIPDIWEYRYFGGTETAGAFDDWDGDGLTDLGEYLADTDPKAPGSNDGPEDKDGDGISNADEVEIYGSDPRLPDTDDDGLPDAAELRWAAFGGNPTNSLQPARSLAVLLGGSTNDFLSLPDDLGNTRFALSQGWTIEARVAGTAPWSNAVGILRQRILPGVLTNAVFGSVLVERRVGFAQETFVLGVDRSGRPVAGFGSTDASWCTVITNLPSDGASWTMLSATYDPVGQILRVFVNGVERGTLPTGGRTPSVTGPGPHLQRLGSGLKGMLDEVRIWDRALPAAQILVNRNLALTGAETNLVALYRFDDNTAYDGDTRGTSLVPTLRTGQVEDFSQAYRRNWTGGWRQGATMHGSISHVPTNAGVVSVSSTNANGVYGPGQVLSLTVRFTGPVIVTGGLPLLQLDVNRPGALGVATNTGGSGTDTLQFRYVVQPDDWSADLDYASPSGLVANGSTLRDPLGRIYSLALPLPSGVGSLGWNKNIQIFDQPIVSGLPVSWLNANFPSAAPEAVDPDGDPDGDGLSNAAEWAAGTDPNDRNSLLRMRTLDDGGGGTMVVNWQATPGKRYVLRYAGNLDQSWTNPPTWQGLEAASDRMSVTDGTGDTPWPVDQRYYRVTVEP